MVITGAELRKAVDALPRDRRIYANLSYNGVKTQSKTALRLSPAAAVSRGGE